MEWHPSEYEGQPEPPLWQSLLVVGPVILLPLGYALFAVGRALLDWGQRFVAAQLGSPWQQVWAGSVVVLGGCALCLFRWGAKLAYGILEIGFAAGMGVAYAGTPPTNMLGFLGALYVAVRGITNVVESRRFPKSADEKAG